MVGDGGGGNGVCTRQRIRIACGGTIVNIRYRDRGNEVVSRIFLLFFPLLFLLSFFFFYQRTLDFRSDYLPFQRSKEFVYG